MTLNFNAGQGALQNWLISEQSFHISHLPKLESIFAQGNGRFGFRAATEEAYVEECRNMFVAGTFNCPQGEHEVPELPNAADLIGLTIWVNGERFALDRGGILAYERVLNLQHGELSRSIVWRSPAGDMVKFLLRRFVAQHDLFLYASQVQIEPLSGEMSIKVQSGVNGRCTNSGVQHFVAGEMRFFDRKIGQLHQTTSQSGIDFVHSFVTNTFLNEAVITPKATMAIGRREMHLTSQMVVPQNGVLTLEKYANVFTSRDQRFEDLDSLKQKSRAHVTAVATHRYDAHLAQHKAAWAHFWQQQDIQIKSSDAFDQLAIRFALYHLKIMTPAHDDRMGIGPKGYTGEGYKGHSFWDTEIYILPFWSHTQPQVARSLLSYRYHLLPGAHAKARANGYMGAMYPWETAWITDGEVTPEWGNVDYLTGEREKIWVGFLQQHISADIAYAIWQYYTISADHDFMARYGYQIIFETADFWQSRLEWDAAQGQYHINNVIGPDEYKEHINNNTFTNMMAHWNMSKAVALHEQLAAEEPQLFAQLNASGELDRICEAIRQKLPKLYLPQPNAALLIPQDDTYLSLPDLPDLDKFKNADTVLTIFKSYSMTQLSQYQVSKQADLVVLFVLLPHLFSQAVQAANFDYYEAKTLHDSSLSYALHSLLAAKLGRDELAYTLWQKAASIDLSQNMHTSHGGIHAAAMGGMWQDVVLGFGGLHIEDGHITIAPRLPETWSALSYQFVCQDNRFQLFIGQDELRIECLEIGGQADKVRINGQWHNLAVGVLATAVSTPLPQQ